MGASILVIGLIGFAAERLLFGSIERATIYRWAWPGCEGVDVAMALIYFAEKL